MKIPVLVLLATALISAVASAAPEASDTDIPRYSDPGRGIDAESGKLFMITLESNRTTGYQWQIARPLDSSAFELIGVEYVTGDKRMPGAPGKENWTFKAVSSGKGSVPIAFKYVRPWEKDTPPAKEVVFFVMIRKGPDEKRLEDMQRELDRLHDENWDTHLGQ